MIARFKQWRFHHRRKLMEKWLADPTSGMATIVNNVATKLAMQMVTNWLDKKAILHCTLCPSTESLKKFAGTLFCPGHFAMVNEKYEQQLKESKEKVAA
jgi:hypothetical protein